MIISCLSFTQQTLTHQHPRCPTLHDSIKLICVHKKCQSAVQIAPVSTMRLFVQFVIVCLPTPCFLSWAMCVLVTRWQEVYRLLLYTVLKASRAKISQPFGSVLFEKTSSGKPCGHALYLVRLLALSFKCPYFVWVLEALSSTKAFWEFFSLNPNAFHTGAVHHCLPFPDKSPVMKHRFPQLHIPPPRM